MPWARHAAVRVSRWTARTVKVVIASVFARGQFNAVRGWARCRRPGYQGWAGVNPDRRGGPGEAVWDSSTAESVPTDRGFIST